MPNLEGYKYFQNGFSEDSPRPRLTLNSSIFTRNADTHTPIQKRSKIHGVDENERHVNNKPLNKKGFELFLTPETGPLEEWSCLILPHIDSRSQSIFAAYLNTMPEELRELYHEAIEESLPHSHVDAEDGIEACPEELFLEIAGFNEEPFEEILARNNGRLSIPFSARDFIMPEEMDDMDDLADLKMDFTVEVRQERPLEMASFMDEALKSGGVIDQEFIDGFLQTAIIIHPFR